MQRLEIDYDKLDISGFLKADAGLKTKIPVSIEGKFKLQYCENRNVNNENDVPKPEVNNENDVPKPEVNNENDVPKPEVNNENVIVEESKEEIKKTENNCAERDFSNKLNETDIRVFFFVFVNKCLHYFIVDLF